MATTLPRNADVADQLDLLADLSEIRGDDSFRVSAYRRAATRVRETSAPVAELALSGRAKELQGIGKTIEEKIVEIVQDGEIHALTRRKAEIPGEVVLFTRLPGLGPKSAKKIWKELGITTLADLRQAAEAQQLRVLPGMGAKTEENVLRALDEPAAAEEPKRTLLGRALPALRTVVAVLAEHPACDQVSIAGSARRYKETVRDLDIIATASDPGALIDYFTTLAWVVDVAAKGPTKATVVSQDGYRFDLRVVPPESYGNLLQHFTGSKDHNVALREAAVRSKLSISEYGVQNTETGETVTARTEEELYRFLGYDFIPPELRENCGELDAAREGTLPKLAELGDLRGDLHTHTHWSADGKNTLEEMVRAAIARGYEYYAITDHSHYLREGRLEEQAKEIAALQEAVAPFRLLRGVEVNIKADGTLDMPDEQLATLDWVVASVHAARQKNPLERVFAAMENPYVDCIGHLTGRKLNKRPPVEIDMERVIEKALETKTFLEMNSQPDRLDLRDVHARAAREAGLKLVVNSDGHEIGAQNYVEFGIGQARRAWLTKSDVVNTRTWKQIERIRKRRPST
ncbi:MAG TPA: DNA polymerase/3'-5' exonuclease PolX [Gaiellaceae bacterium]